MEAKDPGSTKSLLVLFRNTSGLDHFQHPRNF